jgi:hypothetical protein
MADDLDDIKDYHENRRTGSKKVKIDGKTYTGGTKIKLKDGTTARMINVFGNPNDPMMHIIRDDGSKQTMRLSNRVTGKGGRPTKQTKQDAPKREPNPFIKVFNTKADQITKDTKDGKIKTLADLKQHPSYKSTFSGDIKSKLVGAFKAAGGDTSYTPVPKKEVKKKSAGSFAPEKLAKIKPGSFKAAGTSRGPDGVIQIQEPLLLDKRQMDLDRRSMSQRAFIQKYPGQKYASGGLVNANNGAFIEVQNRFSDRLLPGKKRTTRIY